MTDGEIRRHIDEGATHYLNMLSCAPHMQRLEFPGYALARPRAGAGGITLYYDFRFEAMTDGQIRETVAAVRATGLPAFWGCFVPPQAEEFIRQGAPAPDGDEEPEYYMALEAAAAPPLPPSVPLVTVRRVRTPQDFARWARLSNEALNGGFPVLDPENHFPLCRDGKMACYLGCWDGAEASTAAVMEKDGTASLEFVATRADLRHRGLARAACSAALADALAGGAGLITTRAQHGSHALYESLGFRSY